MYENVMEQMLYNIMNTPFSTYPSPHFVTRNVFPDNFHEVLRANLPDKSKYTGLSSRGDTHGYKIEDETRFVFSVKADIDKLEGEQRAFRKSVSDYIEGEVLINGLIQKFGPFISQRFQAEGLKNIGYRLELFKDYTGYELGPHTDISSRILNLFFYLPADNDHPHMGTSFYVPKDRKFTCKGGPHYPFENFVRVFTVPSYQNTAAAFFCNDKSFHGVEPVSEKGYERNALALMLYAI